MRSNAHRDADGVHVQATKKKWALLRAGFRPPGPEERARGVHCWVKKQGRRRRAAPPAPADDDNSDEQLPMDDVDEVPQAEGELDDNSDGQQQ